MDELEILLVDIQMGAELLKAAAEIEKQRAETQRVRISEWTLG